MLNPFHPLTFCSVVLICRATHQVKFFICAVFVAVLQLIGKGLIAGGPVHCPNLVERTVLDRCFSSVVLALSAVCTIGWTTIPFTWWDVPPPLSVSSWRSVVSNANVVGTPGQIFDGTIHTHWCVSISSRFEYETPWPSWFNSLITSTLPVSVFTAQASKMCLAVIHDTSTYRKRTVLRNRIDKSIDTGGQGHMLVMLPGITTGSALSDFNILRIGLDKWALNESQMRRDLHLVTPPTLLQTIRNQSCTSASFIQTFSCHLTITPFRKFKFFGSVFRLNTT